MENFKREFINFLENNYLKIYLKNEIYNEVMNDNVRKFINDLSNQIIKKIEKFDDIDDDFIKEIIIGLADITEDDILKTLEILKEALFKLNKNEKLLENESEKKVQVMEEEIRNLFFMINKTNSLEESKKYFEVLDKLQGKLSKIVFDENIDISNNLRKFIYDFERLDDEKVLERLYKGIFNNEY